MRPAARHQAKSERRHEVCIQSYTWDMSMAAATATSERTVRRTHTYTLTRCGMLNYRHRFSFINLLQPFNAPQSPSFSRTFTCTFLACAAAQNAPPICTCAYKLCCCHTPSTINFGNNNFICTASQIDDNFVILACLFLSLMSLSFAPRFTPCYTHNIRCK